MNDKVITDIALGLKNIAERDTRVLFAISIATDETSDTGLRGWVDYGYPEDMGTVDQWDEVHAHLRQIMSIFGDMVNL